MSDRDDPRWFLLLDETVPACSEVEVALSPSRGLDCISPSDFQWLRPPPASNWGSNLRQRFENKDRARLAIGGGIAPDVVLVSDDAGMNPRSGVFDLSLLLRGRPPGTTVLRLSAPVYLAGDDAVIFYHHVHLSGGFLRFKRRDRVWQPVGNATYVE